MWLYEKRLQYPVNVRKPDAKTAKIVISQLGGPNGELGAALRSKSTLYDALSKNSSLIDRHWNRRTCSC